MKALLGLFLMIPLTVLAVDRDYSYDPSITETHKLRCDFPTEREDGTTFCNGINCQPTEISVIRYWHSTNGVDYSFHYDDTDISDCDLTIRLNEFPLGDHYFKAQTVDVNGLESALSQDRVKLHLERTLSPPNSPEYQ